MQRFKRREDPPPPVTHEIADGILILRFRSPRFTLAEAVEIRDIIYDRLEGVCRHILLNLNGVDYIDSTALSLLVRVSNEMGLRIANVSDNVANILKKMKIFELFYILPSEYEARRSFFEP